MAYPFWRLPSGGRASSALVKHRAGDNAHKVATTSIFGAIARGEVLTERVAFIPGRGYVVLNGAASGALLTDSAGLTGGAAAVTYPVVKATTSAFFNSSDNSPGAAVPAGASVGDLFILAVHYASDTGTVTWPAGFNEIAVSAKQSDIGSSLRAAIRVATGTESGSFVAQTSTYQSWNAICALVPKAQATLDTASANSGYAYTNTAVLTGAPVTTTADDLAIPWIGSTSSAGGTATVTVTPPAGLATDKVSDGGKGAIMAFASGSQASAGSATYSGIAAFTDIDAHGGLVLTLALVKTISSVNGSGSGATLSSTTSLNGGAAVGLSPGVASGGLLAVGAALQPGAAQGKSNGAASGALLASTASVIAGAASNVTVSVGAVTSASMAANDSAPQVDVPAGAVSGNLFVLAIEMGSPTSVVSWPTGFNEVAVHASDTSLGSSMRAAIKLATGTESGKFVCSTDQYQYWDALCAVILGAQETPDAAVAKSTYTYSDTADLSGAAITTTGANRIILWIGGTSSAGGTQTGTVAQPAGMTLDKYQTTGVGTSISLADGTQPAAGTASYSGSAVFSSGTGARSGNVITLALARTASAVNGAASGAALSSTAALTAGAGVGGAAASGQAVSATASFQAGVAQSQQSAAASGATLTNSASIIPGAASAGAGAAAAGQVLGASASLLAGAFGGQSNVTTSGAILAATSTLLFGTAAGSTGAGASGAVLTTASALVAGAAQGSANVTAPGASFTVAGSLLPAVVTGGASASGFTGSGVASLVPGAASGGAVAAGSLLMAGTSITPGAAASAAVALSATLTVAAALVAGAAAGARSMSMSGGMLVGAASLLAGAATGVQSTSASGTVLTGGALLLAGAPSISVAVAGALLGAAAGLAAGVAVGTQAAQVAGQVLLRAAALMEGQASSSADAAGQALVGATALLLGSATISAVVPGTGLTALSSIQAGAAGVDGQALGVLLVGNALVTGGFAVSSSQRSGRVLTIAAEVRTTAVPAEIRSTPAAVDNRSTSGA